MRLTLGMQVPRHPFSARRSECRVTKPELPHCAALRHAQTRFRLMLACGLALLAFTCGAQPRDDPAAATSAALSAAQAWGIVKKTDRAHQQLVVLGIITALNPRGSVVLPNGAVQHPGVNKQQCEDLKTELSEAATPEDYGAAIERLVALGAMQPTKADAELRATAMWRRDAMAAHSRVAASCAELLARDLPAAR
jgi:hypothetical protein